MYLYQFRKNGHLWRGCFETNIPESEAKKVIQRVHPGKRIKLQKQLRQSKRE